MVFAINLDNYFLSKSCCIIIIIIIIINKNDSYK